MNNTPTTAGAAPRKSRGGLVWIAAALGAVLLGGSTFAYWSANELFTGGTITAGNLNLTQVADTAFYDVSSDRTDATDTLPGTNGSQKGHAITNIGTWMAVPGDKVAAVLASSVTLSGDNMVGKLSVTGIADIVSTNSSLTWTYEVYRAGTLVTTETALPTDGALMYLSAPGADQLAGQEDADGTKVFAMSATTETFTIVIYATFADTAGDAGAADVNTTTGLINDQGTGSTGSRQDANSTAALGDILLQLDQVRDTGKIFVVPTP